MKKQEYMSRAMLQISREERNSYKEFKRMKREEKYKNNQKEINENDKSRSTTSNETLSNEQGQI